MLNVFVCTNDFELLAQMIILQHQHKDFFIQGYSSSACFDQEMLLQNDIDVIFLQFSLIKKHWEEWLESFHTRFSSSSIRLILSFDVIEEEHIQILLRYSIDSYLIEPIRSEQLYEILHRQQHVHDHMLQWQNDVERRVTSLLMQLMIPSHLNGFLYLKTACKMAVSVPTTRQIIMKNIYSATARQYHTTSVRVEKCIRSAIHAAPIPSAYRPFFQGDPTSRKVIMYIYACLKGIS